MLHNIILGVPSISLGGGKSFGLIVLCLILVTPDLVKSQSAPQAPPQTQVNELAADLVRSPSEEEQDRLLARKPELINPSLLIALKESVDRFDQKSDYPEAVRVAQLAVRIAERIGDRVELGNALQHLGLMYNRQNSATQALDCFRKSLAIFEAAGDKSGVTRALNEIGGVYASQRKFEQSLSYYDKSLAASEAAGDRSLTALVLSNMGNAHRQLGRYELGMELFRKSQSISEEVNDHVTLAMTLNNIAVLYISQGRYGEALDYLQRSVQLEEARGARADKKLMALRLQNIGVIYRRQGRLDQALAYSRKSLKILEEFDDNLRIADLQNNIGVICKSQGLYEQSLEWFQKSMRRYQKMQHDGGIARSFNNIGDAFRLQGHHDQALEYLRKSLQLREKNRDRGGIALTLNNLGRLYEDQGKYQEMLDVSRRSAGVAEEINAREELWNAQERAGRALFALGRPIEARQSFLAAIATIESLRREVAGGEQQQQTYLEHRLSPWLGMIDLLVPQKEYGEALAFAEQSKARVLLDTLQAGSASLRESLSPRERQAEEGQRLRLVSLNTEFNGELRRPKPDESRVVELKTKIAEARLEYEALETSLYVAHPELRVHRGEAPIIKAEELTDLLAGAASALLEYVVTDGKVYLFAITRTGKGKAYTRLYTLPIKRAVLARQIETFRGQLARRDLGFRASAVKLYELLLKPAEAQLRGKTNLVIAPDASLWDLPFQALVTSRDLFLIEEAAISYAPSLTALREMRKRRERQIGNSAPTALLALGNPQASTGTITRAAAARRDGKLEPLPEAEQEVKQLRRLYGEAQSKVYIGADAREDRVKSEAGRARILHFAAHGILNNASPMYSHLALAPGGDNEDGLLEAWELMKLDLNADLAVLSACETARGHIGAGEGMIGLSWAMFIAGVPSIVVSQWKVESAGTRDLMVNFHRGLITPPGAREVKPTKAEALRQAALKLMKNAETSHPFYWAGFVLVGDGR